MPEEWKRHDNPFGGVLFYTLREASRFRGRPDFTNDVMVRIEAGHGSQTSLEPVVARIAEALGAPQPEALKSKKTDMNGEIENQCFSNVHIFNSIERLKDVSRSLKENQFRVCGTDQNALIESLRIARFHVCEAISKQDDDGYMRGSLARIDRVIAQLETGLSTPSCEEGPHP